MKNSEHACYLMEAVPVFVGFAPSMSYARLFYVANISQFLSKARYNFVYPSNLF